MMLYHHIATASYHLIEASCSYWTERHAGLLLRRIANMGNPSDEYHEIEAP